MIRVVEGIVVSEVDYQESSKMINILTKDLGLIGVMARGCKKLKSNISGIGKLVYGRFYLSERNGRYNVMEFDVIDSFKNVKKDIAKLSYAIYILDLVTQVYRHDNNVIIYDLCINSIKKIEESFEPMVITNILEIKLLRFLGIFPRLDSCVSCGSKRDIVTLSSYRGGYLCKNCLANEAVVTNKTLKLVRMFCYVDIAKISKIEVSDPIKKEINAFIDDYYDRYSGLYLNSKGFLKNLERLDSLE